VYCVGVYSSGGDMAPCSLQLPVSKSPLNEVDFQQRQSQIVQMEMLEGPGSVFWMFGGQSSDRDSSNYRELMKSPCWCLLSLHRWSMTGKKSASVTWRGIAVLFVTWCWLAGESPVTICKIFGSLRGHGWIEIVTRFRQATLSSIKWPSMNL
jgi:hypothetical protein